MKTLQKLAVALLLMGASATLAHSASYTATISSTSLGSVQALLLSPHESLTYSITGTSTGTAIVEKSQNASNWERITSVVAAGAVSSSGQLYSGDKNLYYRIRASTMTAGTFVFTIADNNDLVQQFFNWKNNPILSLYDDGLNVDANLNVVELLPSTATTSGNSVGRATKAYLAGTSAALEGSLVVATTPVAGYGLSVIVAPATTDLTNWVGVAKNAVSTGSIVDVYYSGFVLALTTGTVAVGDTLVSTSSASGYLTGDSTPTSGADVGVAVATGNSAGGRTKIRLK